MHISCGGLSAKIAIKQVMACGFSKHLIFLP